MTAPFRNESELMDLLCAFWDDRLDDASRKRLEELLARHSSPAIELLTSFTRLHLDLEWLISSSAAQEKAMDTLQNVALGNDNERPWLRRTVYGIASLAACILLTLFGLWYFRPPGIPHLTRLPQPVGQVVRLESAVWAGAPGLKTGEAVREGQTIDLQRGLAQISMGYGADLMLEGPCRATLLSMERVVLEQGKIEVRAAKWAIGFKVETEDVLATDLGTWFSMQSGGDKPAEIRVLEGAVLAEPLRAKKSRNAGRRVAADEAIHMMRDGNFQPIKFQREASAERLSNFSPLRPIQIWNTGIGLDEGNEDPHWRVTTGDDRIKPYPQPAVVGVPHHSYGINEPERSQWISVRRGTTKGVPARSRYTFETTFDLTGFDLNSIWVSGQVIADDGVDEISLNGKRLGIESWTDWTYGINYVRFRPIEIRSGFVPGVNRLALVVKNETYIEPTDRGFETPDTRNPMALRVEWQAFGRPLSRQK